MEISTQLHGLIEFGVRWVLRLLLVLSIGSVAVILERFWYFATYRKDDRTLAASMQELLRALGARPEQPVESANPQVMAAVAEGAKAQERLLLERNLAFLGTLGSNAPFIGLFGTVLGIIKAFHDLAGNQSGGPAVVMAGISEALVATAVGLMVAIPAVAAFNYFNRRVRTAMTQVEWRIELALASLRSGPYPGAENAKAAPVPPVSRARWAALRSALLPPVLLLSAGVLVMGGMLLGRRNIPPTAPHRGSPPGTPASAGVDLDPAPPPDASPAPAHATEPIAGPVTEPAVKPDNAVGSGPAAQPVASPGKTSRPSRGTRKRAHRSYAPDSASIATPAEDGPHLAPAAPTEAP